MGQVLVQGGAAGKWQSWDSCLDSLAPEPEFSSLRAPQPRVIFTSLSLTLPLRMPGGSPSLALIQGPGKGV